MIGHNLTNLEDQICRLVVKILFDIYLRTISDRVVNVAAAVWLRPLVGLVASVGKFKKVTKEKIVQLATRFNGGLQ